MQKNSRKPFFSSRLIFSAYNTLWYLALPFLFFSNRLRYGFKERLFLEGYKDQVDIWIQAASSGEAALARQLIESWPEDKQVTIFLSTMTKQGDEILKYSTGKKNLKIIRQFLPFDAKHIIGRAIRALRPKVFVLLETELWPGILTTCSKENIPVVLLNGRMSSKSLARYSVLAGFWKDIPPDRIFAVSQEDAKRFSHVFDQKDIQLMPNIKFDRCSAGTFIPYTQNPLAQLFKAQSQLVVFGSVRKEEELEILAVLQGLMQKRPRSILALFPRHMHRIQAWKYILAQQNLPYTLRSEMQDQANPGDIILWDKFGELESAYALARSVYVGGSLAPLGGQNFLEPLGQGVRPCIGPFWYNFHWVGTELVSTGLVKEVNNKEELLNCLLQDLKSNPSREKTRQKFQEYIQKHKGGTEFALNIISSYLR